MNSLLIVMADLGIRVEYDGDSSDILLDSFRPFLTGSCNRLLSRVRIERSSYDWDGMGNGPVIESSTNLLGQVVLIESENQRIFKRSDGVGMVCTKDFRQASIHLPPRRIEGDRKSVV